MKIQKTKKGNDYIKNGHPFQDVDKTNKELADKGKDIFSQYMITEEDLQCIHGFDADFCPICD